MIARMTRVPLDNACRMVVILAVLVSLMPLSGATQSSSQTSITIDLVEEGVLTISWGSGGGEFTVDGATPTINAATPTVVARAEFTLNVADTQSEDSRHGYSISIHAGPFVSENQLWTIDPDHLSIVAVSGLPDMAYGNTLVGRKLNQPVLLLSTDGSVAIDASIVITVAMTIGPEVRPFTYTGSMVYSVAPLTP